MERKQASRRATSQFVTPCAASYALQIAVEKINGASCALLCCLREAEDVDVNVSSCCESECERCRARIGWADVGYLSILGGFSGGYNQIEQN